MARPKKYTAKALREATDRYFDSITREVTVMEKRDSGRRDDKGHVIYDTVPVENKLGEKAVVTEYIVPPTVGGLCEFLEIHRSTWTEYCDEAKHPEFSDTTTRVRGRMRSWLEEQLLTRKDVKGVIFSLQNNYDYRERREIELGPQASSAINAAGVSMSERREILERIAKEFGEDGEDRGPTEG